MSRQKLVRLHALHDTLSQPFSYATVAVVRAALTRILLPVSAAVDLLGPWNVLQMADPDYILAAWKTQHSHYHKGRQHIWSHCSTPSAWRQACAMLTASLAPLS